jgi:hypothetical protein
MLIPLIYAGALMLLLILALLRFVIGVYGYFAPAADCQGFSKEDKGRGGYR